MLFTIGRLFVTNDLYMKLFRSLLAYFMKGIGLKTGLKSVNSLEHNSSSLPCGPTYELRKYYSSAEGCLPRSSVHQAAIMFHVWHT